jgi:hypothetical protein
LVVAPGGVIAAGGLIDVLGGAFEVATGGSVGSPIVLAGTATSLNAGTVADVTVPTGTSFVNTGTQVGTVTLSGGTVTSSGALGTVNVTAGTVTTTGGTVVAANLGSGATLTSSGALGGTVNVGSGATYFGSGTVGTVNVATGGTLSARGALAAANFAFAAGANLDIEASDPGNSSQRDSLSFRYGAAFDGKFNVRVLSVDGTGARGAPSVFNPRLGYSWTILKDATVAANPSELNLANFEVDANGWLGGAGNWTVALDETANATGNADLKLVYVPTNPLANIDVTTSASASTIAAISDIAADSGFNKTGAGTLTIDTPLAFNGGINVAEGTLVLTTDVDGARRLEVPLSARADAPPTLELVGPADGAVLERGAVAALEARVFDPDTDARQLTVTWESDVDGVLSAAPAGPRPGARNSLR